MVEVREETWRPGAASCPIKAKHASCGQRVSLKRGAAFRPLYLEAAL
jgi:hypothetical protein